MSGAADRAEGDKVRARALLPGVHLEAPEGGRFGEVSAVLRPHAQVRCVVVFHDFDIVKQGTCCGLDKGRVCAVTVRAFGTGVWIGVACPPYFAVAEIEAVWKCYGGCALVNNQPCIVNQVS